MAKHVIAVLLILFPVCLNAASVNRFVLNGETIVRGMDEETVRALIRPYGAYCSETPEQNASYCHFRDVDAGHTYDLMFKDGELWAATQGTTLSHDKSAHDALASIVGILDDHMEEGNGCAEIHVSQDSHAEQMDSKAIRLVLSEKVIVINVVRRGERYSVSHQEVLRHHPMPTDGKECWVTSTVPDPD